MGRGASAADRRHDRAVRRWVAGAVLRTRGRHPGGGRRCGAGGRARRVDLGAGLAAKNIIDIDLTVADPADEGSYVPLLESIGYVLTIREPSFHQHRCLVLSEPKVNLHVYGPDCPESIRHRMFRDWLRSHPDDREAYEQAKVRAIPGGGNVMDYNRRKEDVLRGIYDRMFRAAGMK